MVWLVDSFPAYKSPIIPNSSKLSRVVLTRCHSLRIELCDSAVTNFGLLGLLAEVLSALLSGHLLPSCGIPEVWQISFTLLPKPPLPLPRRAEWLYEFHVSSPQQRGVFLRPFLGASLGIFGNINKERIFQLIQCWFLPCYYAQDGAQGSCVLSWHSTTETRPSFKNVLSLTSFPGMY